MSLTSLLTRVRLFAVTFAFVAATATVATVASSPRMVNADGAVECAAGTSTAELNELFAGQVGDLVGFDASAEFPLPDGRTLWLVQDAFITPFAATARSLRPPTGFGHNAAMVQDGSCFETLHGPLTPGAHCSVQDASYIGRDLTAPCSHWFWPMGGDIDANGNLAVFMGEWANPFGSGAAPPAGITAVWIARINTTTLDVLSFEPAPDAAADIAYGNWVQSDATHSYLFGSSLDQFNVPDPTSPSPSQVFLARVPRGRFDLLPQYWNGATWTSDRAAATPIADGPDDVANFMQPRLIGQTWVSVVKQADWLGNFVRVDLAAQPQGPWTTVQTALVPTRTLDGRTNTYDAHLLPWRSAQGNLVVALSNNAWQMDPLALDNPRIYRQTFFELEAPRELERGPSPTVLSAPLGLVPRTPPVRALDTRDELRLDTGETRSLDLTPFVEPGARAAVINLTVVDPEAPVFVTAWPCDRPQPDTSNVNAAAGAIRAAHAVVTLAADGSICLFANAATDVVVDVAGSYVSQESPGALGFHPQPSTRIYDSRNGAGRWSSGETRSIAVPPSAGAVAVNVTITEPAVAGFVTVYPCGAERPLASNVNMVAGMTVANLVEVGATNGEICIYSPGRTHVVVDLVGTFDARVGGLHYQPVVPTRITDTRAGLGSVIGRVAFDAGPYGVLPANAPVALSVIPSGVYALMTSLIAVSPTQPGWALIAPCIEPSFPVPYNSSTVNFLTGDVVANTSIVPTQAYTGRPVCTFSLVPAYHVVDLVGWFVE